MIAWIVGWLLAAAALLLSDRLFDRVELRGGFVTALFIAALYSLLHFLLSWLIFGVLGIATLGLGFIFRLVTQLVTAAIVLKLTAALSSRFDIRGFGSALGAAILLAISAQIAVHLPV